MSEEKKKGIAPSAADVNTLLIPPSSSSAALLSLSSSSFSPSSSSFLSSLHPVPRIHEVEIKIENTEKKILKAEERRDNHKEGSDLWFEYNNELKQLRTKEEQLREELKRNQLTGKQNSCSISIIISTHATIHVLSK
jgi:hypothetical protein